MRRFFFCLAFGLIGWTTNVQAAETAQPVHLTITAPVDARIWFDDAATTQTGAVRHFVSPDLAASPNRYFYQVRAEWTADGRTVKRTQRVSFRPGDRMLVQFGDADKARVSRMDAATSQTYYYTPGAATVASFAPVYIPTNNGLIHRAPNLNEWRPEMSDPFRHEGQ